MVAKRTCSSRKRKVSKKRTTSRRRSTSRKTASRRRSSSRRRSASRRKGSRRRSLSRSRSRSVSTSCIMWGGRKRSRSCSGRKSRSRRSSRRSSRRTSRRRSRSSRRSGCMVGGSRRKSRKRSNSRKTVHHQGNMIMPHMFGIGGAKNIPLTLARPKKRKGKYTLQAIKRQHMTSDGKVRKGHENALKEAIYKHITDLY